MTEHLGAEHFRRMLEMLEWEDSFPAVDMKIVLHSDLWEDYKKLFKLTDEQMNQYFVKAEYIP